MTKAAIADIGRAILAELPEDGSTVGNIRLRGQVAKRLDATVSESDYFAARDGLIADGRLATGRGRGGSVRLVIDGAPALTLDAVEVPADAKKPRPKQTDLSRGRRKPGQPTGKAKKGTDTARVIAYQHEQKRLNNPDVGVVTPETDPEQPRTRWRYDPHIDPALQFDIGRAQVESLIDDALASGDADIQREALQTLKRMAAPYLDWTGKAERTSFEVDTVSLHVHERIDPSTILAAVQKRMKQDQGENSGTRDMFRAWFEEPLPYREEIEFYKHDRGWMNRLVAGDSLLVMNSLLQKEGMAGQVQMIYIDPPYGIKYGSNFQPFVNKRDVKDRKDEDLTQEPEMIKAFRDTWELGIHSYLTYLRDRLWLAKELLHESGSVFVQISDENLHLVRNLLDEIFGRDQFVSIVAFQTTSGFAETSGLSRMGDYLLWYSKSRDKLKYNGLFEEQEIEPGTQAASWLFTPFGEYRGVSKREAADPNLLPTGAELYFPDNLQSQGAANSDQEFRYQGVEYTPLANNHWKPSVPDGLRRLAEAGRLHVAKNSLRYRRVASDFPLKARGNLWTDTLTGSFTEAKEYVVQTGPKIVERCLLMTTDPGDLVLDPTCGSGTTAFVAEKWGRRWITCDTSRVATTLAKQRLMTASYEYYELKYPHEGLGGGFIYKTVPHVTLKSIANNPEIDEIWERLHPAVEQALEGLNAALRAAPSPQPSPAGGGGSVRFVVGEGGRKGEALDFTKGAALQEWEVPFGYPADWPSAAREAFDAFHAARQAMQRRMDESIAAHADQETLYDQPAASKDKLRITGPFTVEAVPFPTVVALDEAEQPSEADASIARSGESARQHGWRDELLKTGIRGKGGQKLEFAELETLPTGDDFRHLHCTGHLKTGERIVISFGPEHAALEQRQVTMAMREASDLFPVPKMLVFCAFAFDPEAAKDIDAIKGITALKAQMNTDLLTDDLKKQARSNQSFWLMGQPDVTVQQLKDGRYQVEVHGFDYFDTAKGELVSGGKKKIAAWALDTDYDERSLFPRQVFFPMAGKKDGWNKLRKTIRAELNEALLDKLHGTVSLPFEMGAHGKVAVKIVDDRGIESLKVITLD